jgi:RNA polymerase sigma-70 factor (ECF subfamily)
VTPLEAVFREAHGRAVAVLTRQLGSLDLAEEAVAEAFAVAAATWPERGTPPSPAGWIVTTARNRAVDRLRREAVGAVKLAEVARLQAEPEQEEVGAVRDDQLRLLFTCCHPSLAPDARVALTLRMVGGLTTVEIARAFLVPEATMAARITRAKHKIARARIPYRVPDAADLPARWSSVLAVVHLVGTEAHSPATGTDPVRPELAADAVRLARLLVGLRPEEPEARGLLALLLLTASRAPARAMPLDRQDRALWDRVLTDEGQALVRECLRIGRPGPYQVQAAIAAVHADAPTWADTDWVQIVALYDLLPPTPVVQLNRAVAVAELDGPSVGLALVDRVDLDRSPVLHAVRADLLRRLERFDEARAAYDAALTRTQNAAELADLHRRRSALPRR